MAVLEQYKEIRAKQDEMKAQIKAMSEQLFKEGSQELFEKFPQMESFGWRQYTPYFNDGDPCVFSARSDYDEIEVNGEDLWDRDNREEWEPVHKKVGEFLGNFNDEDFLLFFGDHVSVTVDKTGVSVEDYDHD